MEKSCLHVTPSLPKPREVILKTQKRKAFNLCSTRIRILLRVYAHSLVCEEDESLSLLPA
jgi:hypothetical protein